MRFCLSHLRIAVLLIVFCAVPTAAPARAEAQETVVTAGPSWERFTSEDGRGLYHDIIRQVFAGYQVKHLYVPTVQANSMVAIGRADIKMCETKAIESLVLASLPMYENDFYALFLRSRVGQWQGKQSLQGRKTAWREGYYTAVDFPVAMDFIEVRSGEAALQMVIHERVVFYIDDHNLIMESFKNGGEQFDPERFALERVGTRKYFPVFASTSRGEKLRKHYEKEMERLYREGELQKIYDHWGFPVPRFHFDDDGKTGGGTEKSE